MAPRITMPLYIECANPQCLAIKQVKTRALQQAQRFCSRRCGTAFRMHMNLNREAQSRGGKMRAHRMRVALMEKLKDMTLADAFRLGYARGLQSKWRQTRRIRRAA